MTRLSVPPLNIPGAYSYQRESWQHFFPMLSVSPIWYQHVNAVSRRGLT